MNKYSLDLFLEACGASGPLQLSIGSSHQQEISRRVLPQPFLVIGRHPRTDLSLDHEQISQRHAYVQVLDGRVFCMDLGSRTGISWESGSKRAGWLERHQTIHIGPFSLRIAHNPMPPQEQRTGASGPAWAHPPLPGVRLDFQGGAGKQASSWRMSQSLALIGKAEACKVRLLAPGVARFHASLIRTRHGVWVVDLLGQEGLAVNGSAVRCALLENGDQLEISKFMIRVCYDALPAASLDLPESRITVAAPPTPSGLLPAERETSDAGEPVSPGPALLPRGGQAPPQTELVEALLVPLAQQFQLMQQQMFDQFQQTLLMMVQMFSALHRDQVGLIRQELDRLNQLTAELQTLKAELVKHSSSLPAEAGFGTFGPPLPLAATLMTFLPSLGPQSVSPGSCTPPGGTSPESASSVPTAPESGARSARTSVPTDQEVPQSISSTDGPAAERATGAPLNGTAPAPSDPVSAKGPGPKGVQSEQDVHAWLCQRIATLQQERHSRWQKLLHFLLGR